MPPERRKRTLEEIARLRLGLRNAQFLQDFRFENAVWFLDGKKIGFGDLSNECLLRISNELRKGEEFEARHEVSDKTLVTIKDRKIQIPKNHFGKVKLEKQGHFFGEG
jgi:hypothetical protein